VVLLVLVLVLVLVLLLSAWRKIIDGLPRPNTFSINERLTAPRPAACFPFAQTALFRKPTFFLSWTA